MAGIAGVALPRDAEAHALLDARGDRDLDLALLGDAAGAAAVRARVLDERPLSAAARAGGRHGEEALVAVDLAAAAAGRARRRARAGLRAGPAAGRAGLLALQGDRALDALVDLLERELERDLEIASGLRTRPPAAAEHVAEDAAAE